jgi:hypothetical protein
MSSLLQFGGNITKDGVHLELYLAEDGPNPTYKGLLLYPTEEIDCIKCGRKHPQLYTIIRKPIGMMGHWVVFRYLGEEHVPDLSCPIAVPKLPRGAKKMTPEENAAAWHRR